MDQDNIDDAMHVDDKDYANKQHAATQTDCSKDNDDGNDKTYFQLRYNEVFGVYFLDPIIATRYPDEFSSEQSFLGNSSSEEDEEDPGLWHHHDYLGGRSSGSSSSGSSSSGSKSSEEKDLLVDKHHTVLVHDKEGILEAKSNSTNLW